jgi:hypothetical protein
MRKQGFCLANKTSQSIYDVFGQNPEKAALFSNAMKAYMTDPSYDVKYLLDNYDWASLGEAKVVDIGGSQGHVAVELARRFRGLSITVQDMEMSILGSSVPFEVKDRVKFMAHNFFMPQTVSADVYFFRWIMHNWSDKYCIRMLKALIPELKPGARIVIQDSCMPEPGTGPLWRERDLRLVITIKDPKRTVGANYHR